MSILQQQKSLKSGEKVKIQIFLRINFKKNHQK